MHVTEAEIVNEATRLLRENRATNNAEVKARNEDKLLDLAYVLLMQKVSDERRGKE